MEQPDISKPKGRRDLAMLLLLYDSAARVQELCDLKVCDVRLDTPAVARLFGKGRKNREVPLSEPCVQVLQRYIQENHLDTPFRSNDPLFVNPQGKKLTRSGVSYVLAKYIRQANETADVKMPEITPHCLRHSKAMHLVEAEKNLIYIRIIRLSAKGTNGVMKRRDANASKFCYTIRGKVRQTTEPVEVSGGVV